MRKAFAAVLTLLAAIAISLASWSLGWNRAEIIEQQEAAGTAGRAAHAEIARACLNSANIDAVECIVQRESAFDQSNPTEREIDAQENSARWALFALILSALGFLISTLTLWFLKGTLDATRAAVKDAGEATEAMRDANRINERDARRSLRPYVWPDQVWFEMLDNGEPLAHIHMKNFGQTPAINVRGWDHTWLADFPLTEPLPEPSEGEVDMSSSILGPGQQSESHQPHGAPLCEAALQMINEETAALYVYGFGSYLDTFGKERFYKYIYFSHGDSFERGRFAPYMSGNIIDVE